MDSATSTKQEKEDKQVKDVMNMKQACHYLELAKPTLYKMVRGGTVPAFKIGSVWRFRKESLDQWMEQRVERDTAQRSSAKKKSIARL